MCEFDQNEDTFSVYFDELEHYFIEMVRKNILEGKAVQEEYPGYGSRNSPLKFVWCVAVEQNNNSNKNSDASDFYWIILIARIESLRSEAHLSADKKNFSMCVNLS